MLYTYTRIQFTRYIIDMHFHIGNCTPLKISIYIYMKIYMKISMPYKYVHIYNILLLKTMSVLCFMKIKVRRNSNLSMTCTVGRDI